MVSVPILRAVDGYTKMEKKCLFGVIEKG